LIITVKFFTVFIATNMATFSVVTTLVISTGVDATTFVKIDASVVGLVVYVSRITTFVSADKVVAFLVVATRVVETFVDILTSSVGVFVTLWAAWGCWFGGSRFWGCGCCCGCSGG